MKGLVSRSNSVEIEEGEWIVPTFYTNEPTARTTVSETASSAWGCSSEEVGTIVVGTRGTSKCPVMSSGM
jgi:hypothetical protein